MAESEGGDELPQAPSRPPASQEGAGGIQHLGEIPALDEVPGKVPGG